MSKQTEILIAIANDGGMKTKLSGFNGNDCIAEAQEIARELAQLGVILDIQQIERNENPSIPEVVPTKPKTKKKVR